MKTAQGPEGQILQFPDDATDDEMAQALEQVSRTVKVREHARKPRGKAARAVAHGAGGMIGGLLGDVGGPLGNIGGSAAGGAVGEMLAQAGEQGVGPSVAAMGNPQMAGQEFAMPQPNYNLGAVLQAGAEQGAASLAGLGLAKGLQAGAKLGTRIALKVTPEVAQTAIREGITATGQGLAKLMARIKQVGADEVKIARAAAGAGRGWVDTQNFAREVFMQVAPKIEGGGEKAIGELDTAMAEWLKSHPYERMSPAHLLKVRRWSDATTAEIKRAGRFGGKVVTNMEKLWNDAVSNRARDVLRTEIPEIVDPKVYAKLSGKETIPSELQGVKDSLVPILKRGKTLIQQVGEQTAPRAFGAAVGSLAGAAVPGDRGRHAWEGAVAGAALSHPAILSTLSLYLQNPALAQVLLQAPRAALGLAQSSEEPQQ